MISRLKTSSLALITLVMLVSVFIFSYLFDVGNVKIVPSPGLNALCVKIDRSHKIKTPGKFEVLGTLIKIDDFYVKICKNKSEDTLNE